jgi:hypothetical protein
LLAHVFRQYTHTDTSEVVDGKSGVSGVLCWEETLEAGAENLISEAGLQARKTQILCQVLEEDLDEDTAAGGGLLFVKMDDRQNMPADGIVAD